MSKESVMDTVKESLKQSQKLKVKHMFRKDKLGKTIYRLALEHEQLAKEYING